MRNSNLGYFGGTIGDWAFLQVSGVESGLFGDLSLHVKHMEMEANRAAVSPLASEEKSIEQWTE
jgi:hypothetical protein